MDTNLEKYIRLVLEQLEFDVVTEELTPEETDHVDIGNSLLDPELDIVTVDSVDRDENGEVQSVDVFRYETPDSENEDPRLYRRTVPKEELETYELA